MSILSAILRALGCEQKRPEAVDIAPMLDKLAAHDNQSLDWRHSIVDLMKLLGLDSSLDRREQLADELGYTGEMVDGGPDNAVMNQWLHREVMRRVAENGGQVPEGLR